MSALDRLHRLTRKAEQLADKQRTLQDEASFASALEEEVAMLERRKAGAMRALEAHRPAQIARRPDGAGDSREVDAGATAERAKSLDAFSMALAHRLMGRSIFFPERDPDCVGIRFDTCFGGTFFEQYYVILETRPNGGLSLRSHTLPASLPVEALARSMLPDRVVGFADAVQDAVRAMVYRRESVRTILQRRALSLGAVVHAHSVMTTEGFERLQLECEEREGSAASQRPPAHLLTLFPHRPRAGNDRARPYGAAGEGAARVRLRVAFPLAGVRPSQVEAVPQGRASRKRRRGRELEGEEMEEMLREARFAARLEREVARAPVDGLAAVGGGGE